MSETTTSEDTEAITFEMTVTPSDAMLGDLFTTALEGGINYWASVSAYKWQNRPEPEYYAVIHESENEDKEYRVTIETIREGLRNIVTNQVKYNLGEGESVAKLAIGLLTDEDYDYDAGDADNVVQAGLFKEIVYG